MMDNIGKNEMRLAPRHLLPNLLVAIFVIYWAIREQWPAAQMIWPLWAASLLFGTLFFAAGIVIKGKTEINVTDRKKKYFLIISAAILFGILALLPILFFHSLYALFLNHLFPILDWDPMGKHISLVIPFTWEILIQCVKMYWVFLLGVFVTKIIDLIRLNRSGNIRLLLDPFKAVVQMHILILAFGFLSTLHLSSNTAYLLLIFAFFQVPDLLVLTRQWLKPKKNTA
jgi:hypothetical protein